MRIVHVFSSGAVGVVATRAVGPARSSAVRLFRSTRQALVSVARQLNTCRVKTNHANHRHSGMQDFLINTVGFRKKLSHRHKTLKRRGTRGRRILG